ncbi:MAG: hypothetical protein OEY63_05620, partial [Gemmatimonadota bacterium]|nr:hypothetical protein [Gemmatimonadota bacterium]
TQRTPERAETVINQPNRDRGNNMHASFENFVTCRRVQNRSSTGVSLHAINNRGDICCVGEAPNGYPCFSMTVSVILVYHANVEPR